MIVTGSTLDDTDRAIALCQQYPRPCCARPPVSTRTTRRACKGAMRSGSPHSFPIRWSFAAGECGLDYYPELSRRRPNNGGPSSCSSPWPKGNRKPLFLHQRDAQRDFLEMLRAHPQGRFARRCCIASPRGRPCLRIASRSALSIGRDRLDLR
jgi:Tat protein secretion system quality control protein TatD with DNase activity